MELGLGGNTDHGTNRIANRARHCQPGRDLREVPHAWRSRRLAACVLDGLYRAAAAFDAGLLVRTLRLLIDG